MSLRDDIKARFQAHADLDEIEVWFGKVPADLDDTYPRCVMTIQPSSGRQQNTFDETSYEPTDVRLEVFSIGDTEVDIHQAALEAQFGNKQRFSLGTGFLGVCQRTSSFTRYVGRSAAQREIYSASIGFRLMVQKN